jgi:hypothetical protein
VGFEQHGERAPHTIQPVSGYNVEPAAGGIVHQPLAVGALGEGERPAPAVVDVLTGDGVFVKRSPATQEVELGLDGLSLGLILRTDAGVEGDAEGIGQLRVG